jgi:predicted molibdopterin-dependent oxidoreductase YjgC
MNARLVRLAETGRQAVALDIDGVTVQALAGDTLLTAVLAVRDHLRRSEFGGERRAGFCLMGACQDCWVWSAAGERLRACTTEVSAGLRICTTAPDQHWADVPAAADSAPESS